MGECAYNVQLGENPVAVYDSSQNSCGSSVRRREAGCAAPAANGPPRANPGPRRINNHNNNTANERRKPDCRSRQDAGAGPGQLRRVADAHMGTPPAQGPGTE